MTIFFFLQKKKKICLGFLQISQEPLVRLTSFNFSVGGIEALSLIILGIGVTGSFKQCKSEAADIAITRL